MNKLPNALRDALSTIADIAEGSTTANSLPHIAKIARAALESDHIVDASEMVLPPMPSNTPNVTRRIRRCETEVPAQLVLEYFAQEYARAALRAEQLKARHEQ